MGRKKIYRCKICGDTNPENFWKPTQDFCKKHYSYKYRQDKPNKKKDLCNRIARKYNLKEEI
jgi:hypothetical protein